MGKSSKHHPERQQAALIKGYLPVRVILPDKSLVDPTQQDYTFFYVKKHQEGKSSHNQQTENNDNDNDNNTPPKNTNATLFIANAPIVPGIKTKLLLENLLGNLGDIERVTVTENPRKRQEQLHDVSSISWASPQNNYLQSFIPTFLGPIHAKETFAYVQFTCPKEMKKALNALQNVMSFDPTKHNKANNTNNNSELPGLKISKVDLQMLRAETDRLYREEMAQLYGEDNDDDDEIMDTDKHANSPKTGILALAERYRKSLKRISRDKLLDECNAVMQEYEDAEKRQRLEREAAANQPDEDGFITVTSKSVGVEASRNELEREPAAAAGKRRKHKRNRKKKESTGASELQDFYRFQRKETRKRNVQDLREKFEEDLKKVKKMKEERQYKPF